MNQLEELEGRDDDFSLCRNEKTGNGSKPTPNFEKVL
jgi:hypothetical protein